CERFGQRLPSFFFFLALLALRQNWTPPRREVLLELCNNSVDGAHGKVTSGGYLVVALAWDSQTRTINHSSKCAASSPFFSNRLAFTSTFMPCCSRSSLP